MCLVATQHRQILTIALPADCVPVLVGLVVLVLIVPVDHIHVLAVDSQDLVLVAFQLLHIGTEPPVLLLQLRVLEPEELDFLVLALLDVVGHVLVVGLLQGLARLVQS